MPQQLRRMRAPEQHTASTRNLELGLLQGRRTRESCRSILPDCISFQNRSHGPWTSQTSQASLASVKCYLGGIRKRWFIFDRKLQRHLTPFVIGLPCGVAQFCQLGKQIRANSMALA
jgi:hypothetical protein